MSSLTLAHVITLYGKGHLIKEGSGYVITHPRSCYYLIWEGEGHLIKEGSGYIVEII